MRSKQINVVYFPRALSNQINLEFVDAVAEKNVALTIENIRKMSPILKELEDNNEIDIVGAMYDINTGAVDFFE